MKVDSMLKNSAIITIIVLMLAVSASAIPPLPSEFYGSVSQNGVPAPAGTVIEATIFDEVRGTLTTDEEGIYGGSGLFDPRLVVSATEEDVEEGDPEITFYIGGTKADQTVTFIEGTTTDLDLTTGGSQQVVADFYGTPTSGQKPLTVQFTDTSTGNPTMWAWDFGDGGTAMVADPSYTYTEAGIYTVSLTASSQTSGSDTITKAAYITVTEQGGIVADFSATPTSGQKPLTVQFTDLSTGSPTMWAWDFGDGGTAMVADPSYTYTEAGIYTVSLTASSQTSGSDTITKAAYITVTEQGGIVADFSATPTYGEKPLTVQFTDLSTGSPTMWAWDFGDGGTAMVADPSYTYTKAGTYSVTLTASSQTSGSDTVTKTEYITVIEQGGIVADFSATPTYGEKPLTVQFTDLSTGSPTMWAWDFGDGGTAMVADPSYTYTEAGTYSVTLTASSQITGTDTITKTGYITVTEGPGPVASFTAEPTGGKKPLTVTFTDTSTGNPTSWEWDFGDETGSNEQNPVHTYEIANLYSVTLTVSNNEGSDTFTWEDYISVSGDVPPPAAVFTAEPRSGSAPLTVQFTDMSPGTPRWWLWRFGDGSESTEADPVHTYTQGGSYDVYLKVGNSGGADSTLMTDFITVSGTGDIVADFSGTPTRGEKPLTVQFTDLSTGNPTMWAWDFGDGGGTSMVADPSYTYSEAGTYSVTLTASSQTSTDTITKTGYITVTEQGGIVADFSGTPTRGEKPLTVQFTDLSTGNPTMWAWDFGDGGTAMVADPSYTYTKAGTYSVKLTASSQITGTDTITKEGYITVTEQGGIVADFSGTPTRGEKPLTVQFTDLSTGSPTMWAWDFGDGGGTSMVANPSYTYTEAGTYSVTLTASSQITGTDTVTKKGYITVTEQGGIVAEFKGTPTSGPAPLTVQFSDQSTGSPTMWAWDFGDEGTSMVANPSHTYTNEGTYTVSLTASSQITGTDTITKPKYITVTKPGTEGTISVSSTPSGAEVYIDDEYVGITPVTKTGLTYGEHRVRLSLSGYKPWEKTVYPLPGKPVEISATLEPSGHEVGSINLQLAPQWSTVYLDGVEQGQTQLSVPFIMSNLEEGTYDLKITRPGFEDYQKRIPVYAGQTTKIYARMTMKPGTEPGIMIDSIPRGAGVMVDGSAQGITPLVVSGVGAGEHNVQVKLDGYFDWQQTIEIESGKTSYVTAVLYPEFWAPTAGYMMVTSLPERATIYLDGTQMGQTPITLSAVAPGDHIVRLEMENYQPWEQAVTVREGKTSYVIAKMTQ